MNVTLSVCIPTFHRASTLRRTLPANLAVAAPWVCEILVCDNASPDETASVVTALSHPAVRYECNERNVGYDENVLRCLERARGEFVLFLSDEDVLCEDGLEWVASAIQRRPAAVLGTILRAETHGGGPYYDPGDRVLRPGAEALTHLLFQNSYLSGLTLRRELLDCRRARMYGRCAYIHQYLLGQAVAQGSAVCTSRPICRMGTRQGSTITSTVGGQELAYSAVESRVAYVAFRFAVLAELIRPEWKGKGGILRRQERAAAALVATSLLAQAGGLRRVISQVAAAAPKLVRLAHVGRSPVFWSHFIARVAWGLLGRGIRRPNPGTAD